MSNLEDIDIFLIDIEKRAQNNINEVVDEKTLGTNATEASDVLIFPVKNGYVTHGFDEDRNGNPHGGYDIGSKTQPAYIVACCDCKVYAAGWSDSDKTKSFGLRVWLEPIDNELKKKYPFIVNGHMEKLMVQSGKILKAGDVIGLMGNTGASKGVHLHIEARTLPSTKGKSIRISEYES